MYTTLRAALGAGALLLAASTANAQQMVTRPLPEGGPPNGAPAAGGEIRGRLVEATSGAPIGAGSVTVRRASDSSFVGGALPAPDGSFRVNGLRPGIYTVRFRAIGFAPLVRGDVSITASQIAVDLGDMKATSIPVQLEEQTVTAERPDVTVAPDRNSYSVKNMASASGGTAVDALRNVPSVEVDGSNNITLRGNANVVVQINGRATPLSGEQLGNFLAQIPSSSIKNIEVATNPSAKNDPEGTAGIINIVLNQEAEQGLSGGVSAGTGSTGLANVSGNVGRQKGPFTFYTSYNFFRDQREFEGSSSRENLIPGLPAFTNGTSEGHGHPRSQNATLRSEYKLSPRDAFTFDGTLSAGHFQRESGVYYANLDDQRSVTGLFNQFSSVEQHNLSQDYALAFRRTGSPKTTTFSSELRYTRNKWDIDNRLSSAILRADSSTGTTVPPAEFDNTLMRMPSWVWQTDYTKPFGTGTKIEAGLKGTSRSTANDFTAAYRDAATGTYDPAADRASAFTYKEQIGAAYSVLSQRVKKVDGQLGLRLEQASTRLAVPTTGQRYDNDYASAFPSAILSYNATEMRQVKASYSRRITRPDPFQLTPIGFREDARNAMRGNPALRPEYTDAFELGLQETRKWGSIQLTPYLRKTAHAVRFIRTVDTAGVSVGTFANVASTTAAGGDLNVTYRIGGLNVFGGGGAFRYTSDAGALSTKAFIWNARANASYKLSPTLDLQMFANYRAPAKTEGGSQKAFVFSNVALRRKLWGDKGSLTLRVQDPFNLTQFGFETRNGQVIETSERRFGMRGVFLSFSRNFGQQLKLRPRPQEPDAGAQGPGVGGP
ncbi:MAG TPA: TonB-dependent receptor [Gemmatimonadaceae bacterium]|nr:TonB-dependent receptor [Gemmatimonadaceae bacterium]